MWADMSEELKHSMEERFKAVQTELESLRGDQYTLSFVTLMYLD